MPAAFLLALSLLIRSASAAAPLSPPEARARLEAGDGAALDGLNAWVLANPDDTEGPELLASALLSRGETDAALAVLEERGARPGGEALAVKAAQVHSVRAEDGPYVTRSAHRVMYRPSDGSIDEAAWKTREQEAVVRLIQSVWDHPFADPSGLRLLAVAQFQLGRDDEALATLQQLSARFPEDVGVREDVCALELGLHPGDRAIAACEQALAMAPESGDAHRLMAKALAGAGRAKEAEAHAQMAELYSFVAPFGGVPFSKARLKQARSLAGHFEQGAHKDSAAATLRQLGKDPSPEATTLILAFAWHHSHDELENEAWHLLVERPETAPAMILGAIGEAQSTCTVSSATWVLATLHHPGAFDVLARLLPADRSAPMPMNIADNLDILGDPRAVPLLVAEVQRSPAPGSEASTDPMAAMSAEWARRSAALALGAFDTPASRDALATCSLDDTLGLDCHAALYRLTRDEGHLTPIREAGAKGDYIELEIEYIERTTGISLKQ